MPKGGDKNKQLTVGYKGDRSYVLRGNHVGVFRHTRDGVKYYATISGIADMKGKKFDPKNVSALSGPSVSVYAHQVLGHAPRTRHEDDINEPRCSELPLQPGYRGRQDRRGVEGSRRRHS